MTEQAQVGSPMSTDDIEMLKRFRVAFLPDARIEGQETFAKWLFGLTTTIAALGTGFSHSAFSNLSGLGDFFYSLGVLSAGAGLACAVWAISAESQDANWSSFDAMTGALTKLVHKKKSILRAATLFLFLSFMFAAAAPLVTVLGLWPARHPSGMTLRLSGRTLQAGILLANLRPGNMAQLDIYRENTGSSDLLELFRQVATSSGQISVQAPEIKLSPEAQNLKVVLSYQRGIKTIREEQHLVIPQAAAPAGPKPGPSSSGKNRKTVKYRPKEPKGQSSACPCTSGLHR